MALYKTPGVYIEEISKFPPSVAPVETAIPAFIGYTQKAGSVYNGDVADLKLKPTRISSMVEYEFYFGRPQPENKITVDIAITDSEATKFVADLKEIKRSKHVMYYALQMFFANGGGPCYIVSVGRYKDIGTSFDKKELDNGLDEIKKEDEPTLIVFPEAQYLSISDFQDLHDKALQQCADLKDRFVIMDVHGGAGVSMSDLGSTTLTTAIGNFRDHGLGTKNLKYGAVYAPNIETTLNFLDYDENETEISVTENGGAPTKLKLSELNPAKEGADSSKVNSQHYEIAKAAISNMPNKLPPAAAMAGIYAAVDSDRGVWKAPANISVATAITPTVKFTSDDLDQMNVHVNGGKSVNAIRPFIGQGTLVWGARTLAGNDNEWRYINVRRFFTFVETSVKKATMQFVFEPNDANTWVKVQGMIENFLTTLWRQGALQGVKPEHAFYVAVGLGKTMTALDILEGRMIVEIGMAAVRPAEFIVLQFSHKMAES
jgi:phage tail sheath protein FI